MRRARAALLLATQLAACLGAHVAAPPARAAAQELRPVTPGSRVRVTVSRAGAPRYVGVLDTLTPDTLALRIENRLARRPVAIPVASVTSLEVSRRRGVCSGRRFTCLVVGGVAGIAAGTAAAYVLGGGPGYLAGAIGLLTVPVGFFAGVGVGGTVGGDQWERVSLPAHR